MATQETKLRMLRIYQILKEETDEEHILNASEIEELLLRRYETTADRRSIYADINSLIDFGIDIVTVKGKNHGYFIASRDFELAELKILVDSVQVAKFITQKKSEQLIKKLKIQASRHQAKQLQKQVTLINRPKAKNETIFYNIDAIHTAIYQGHPISFQYTDWSMKKELSLRKDGASYHASPWALIWDDEFYYLVAYDHDSKGERHYRVDKMKSIKILEGAREGKDLMPDFNAADFGKKTFGMWGGKDTNVTLLVANTLVGVILDRFGSDVLLAPSGKDHFKVNVPVTVSPQFFGWITALGKDIEIKSPPSVRKEYASYLKDSLSLYKG